ncbi:FAD-dependent oxidoreductase [Lactococcus formosensis]|jgi:NADPH-dependent 2,4-dienoyl-CoA reductase/sulfur reductase-like enzyme/rhodanese-related sulfurtransferase|uniref:FAD-dependent oxidoreductase n=1 Tax=Lactococcus formosensis TaxID=1281486 RepID=A0A9X4P4G8_9LACT|nr:FAD-dependent oxidoreductase [Lactococcus formosensis]MDG6111911.1 FAD-dependent oxidoreductase [Lactococcus formosensis]MDG6118186.1 FAD-dependent oxidoreductase [Lactococcus formosensis]MDG6133173.1 FAD-dependent oxidoreductase [Lactococcus formosensis]MDG6134942.1 FAD-dependent oxidoreductase [Lactococcus formosensis]MDG6139084.1 FAD-dependent oxidoreductase [Lactococcus formosensis]
MTKKYLIVGGVAGGMSAATRLRRLKEDAEIIVFDKGPYVSFANCGLPYYLSGEIESRNKLILQTPESLAQRFNLDVRPDSEVVSIEPDKKEITVVSNGTNYTENYDALILSPGASPFIPPIKGLAEADNVFSLRNIPDLDKITDYMEMEHRKQALIIGAGFIGLEMAENLRKLGLEVTIVEKADHVLPTLDQEMAIHIEEELAHNGLKVLTGVSVVEFQDQGKTVILENGDSLSTDVVILSVGIQVESKLAADAGIKLGMRGAILVDEQYQTSVPDIYAVGDAILVKNQITGNDALISLASPANRQGRQVADVLAGLPVTNKGSIGTAIVRTFSLTAASTGLSEKQVQDSNLKYKAVHITANDHAGYYPGASSILLKLIFNPESGHIFGASAVGQKGVDKRIDVLATAIKAGMTVFDLPELELSYAPPFGSAKDPVNMIGYAAMNIAMGLSDNIQWHQLEAELAQGKVLLDVRQENEVARGGFKEAINIPLNDLRQNMDKLDKNKAYIVSCQSGLRSYTAERILKQEGFKVENLDGAYGLYSKVKGL